MIRNGRPTIDDPDVSAEVEFKRGFNEAAAIDEPDRTWIYRRWHRVSQHPYSRGFRAFVIGSR